MISCVFTTVGTCEVAIALKHGILFGHFVEKPNNTIRGKITGGSGLYKGATGAIASGRGGRTIVTWSS